MLEHWEDRNCDICIYRVNGACIKWDCEYTPKEEEENN